MNPDAETPPKDEPPAEMLAEDDVAEIVDDAEDAQVAEDAEEASDAESAQDDSRACFDGHSDAVYCVAVHPTLPLAVSGGGDDVAHVWDYRVGQAAPADATVETIRGGDSVVAAAFSHDGRFLATGAMDGRVLLFEMDAAGGAAFAGELEGPSEVTWLSWHGQGDFLLAGASDGLLFMWQAAKRALVATFSGGHAGQVTCGQFAPSGKLIVSGGDEGNVCVWRPMAAHAAEFKWMPAGHARWHQAGITALAVDSDSKLVLSGDQLGTVCLVSAATGAFLGGWQAASDSIESLAFSALGEAVRLLAIVGSADGTARVHEVESDMRVRRELAHDDGGAVTRAMWISGPRGPRIATASTSGVVRLWDARTLELLSVYHGHDDAVLDMAVSPDGNFLLTASDDRTCLVFDI